MPTITLRKREGLSYIPGQALPKRVVPAFLMCRLSSLLANTTMGLLREDGLVGLPEIAVTGTMPKLLGNPVPQATTGSLTVIADDNGENMACPP